MIALDAFDTSGLQRHDLARKRWAVQRYVRDACGAGEDPRRPGLEWLERWMVAMHLRYSHATFIQLIRTLTRYFRAQGVANPVHDPRVCNPHPEWGVLARVDFDAQGLGRTRRAIAQGIIRRYVREALSAGIDPDWPDPQWLSEWAYGLLRRYALAFVRIQLRYLTRYFSFRRLPDPLQHPIVVQRLCELSVAITPQRHGFLAPDVRYNNIWPRAQYYANGRLAQGTRQTYTREAERYEIYAHEHGFDPRAATPQEYAEYLAYAADAHGPAHIQPVRVALAYYFRQTGNHVHRDPLVRRVIAGISKEIPTPDPPLSIAVLRKLLAYFSHDAPIDIRTRTLILTIYFGGTVTTASQQSLLRQGLLIDKHGVQIVSTDPRRPIICVPALNDPELDIRVWMRRWLAIIGKTPGPLFRRLSQRGQWIALPPGPYCLKYFLARAACAAGLDEKRILPRLRQGAMRAATRRLGPVIVAQHFGLRSTTSTPYVAAGMASIAPRREWNFRRREE